MASGRHTACKDSFVVIGGVRNWKCQTNRLSTLFHVDTCILSSSVCRQLVISPSQCGRSPMTRSGTKGVLNAWRSCSHRPWQSAAIRCRGVLLRPLSLTEFRQLAWTTGNITRSFWRQMGGNTAIVYAGFGDGHSDGDGDRDHAIDVGTNYIQTTNTQTLGEIDSLRPTFANIEDRLASHSPPRYGSRPSPTGINGQESPPALVVDAPSNRKLHENEKQVVDIRDGQVALEGCVYKILHSNSDTGYTVARVNPTLLPTGWMSGRTGYVQKYRMERNIGVEEVESVVVKGKLGGIAQGQRLRFWGDIKESKLFGGHEFVSNDVEEMALETKTDMLK